MEREAIISRDGRYRYWLVRVWDTAKPRQVFVMLNPSTADAAIEDPTIRRCIGFASREGAGGLIVVNLFAFRATKPVDLWRADDPIGPENATHLLNAFEYAAAGQRPVVCGWGALGHETVGEAGAVALARDAGATLVCLGRTNGGAPCHPLYRRSDQPLVALL